MSLHALAHHMQAKGRNGDSVLVHMTPNEVHGLQALAMAHGGSLTTNPETGLPEASFLSSILPAIAGFALNAFLPGVGTAIGSALGTSGAVGTGLLVGGATGLATGSLSKGLMAGLGAYGGAGMATGLTETGAALNGVPQATAGNPAITQIGAPIQEGATSPLMQQIEQSRAAMNMAPPSGVAQSMGLPGKMIPTPTAITPSSMDLLTQGAKAGFGNGMEGLKSLYGNLPTGTLPALGAFALMNMNQDKGVPAAPNQGMIRPYKLDRQQNPDAYQANPSGYRMPVDSRGNVMDSSERRWFNDTYTAGTPYKAPGPEYAADGGLMGLAVGGQAEQRSAFHSVGMNANYPQSQIDVPLYTEPGIQRPMAKEVVNPAGDVDVDVFTGEPRGFAMGGMTAFGSGGATAFASPEAAAPTVDYKYNPQNMEYTKTTTTPPPASIGGKGSPFGIRQLAGIPMPSGPASYFMHPGLFQALQQQQQAPQPTVQTETIGGMIDPYMPPQQQTPHSDIANYADGGIANLGGYSDGGRLLRGPGDGVSDSIPASIGGRQPARLADGEFVVPARIVSEIGNGSTEAGARKLYKMMDRVQHARSKTVGKHQVAKNTNAEKLLPA